MTDLGTLGGEASAAPDLNNSGLVVGDSSLAGPGGFGPLHTFVWDPASRALTDLGTLGGSWSNANGINDRNVIAGRSATSGDGAAHAFMTSVLLGPPPTTTTTTLSPTAPPPPAPAAPSVLATPRFTG